MAKRKTAGKGKTTTKPIPEFKPGSFARDIGKLEKAINSYETAFKKRKNSLDSTVVSQLNALGKLRQQMESEIGKKGTKYSIRFDTITGKKLFEKFTTLSEKINTQFNERRTRRSRAFQRKEGKTKIETIYKKTNKELNAITAEKNKQLTDLRKKTPNWLQRWRQELAINKQANLLRTNVRQRENLELKKIKQQHFLGARRIKVIKSWKARRFRA